MTDYRISTLYDDCIALGIPIDHHASDLYIPCTDQTRELIAKHKPTHYQTFTDQITGGSAYCVSFAYDPFWSK